MNYAAEERNDQPLKVFLIQNLGLLSGFIIIFFVSRYGGNINLNWPVFLLYLSCWCTCSSASFSAAFSPQSFRTNAQDISSSTSTNCGYFGHFVHIHLWLQMWKIENVHIVDIYRQVIVQVQDPTTTDISCPHKTCLDHRTPAWRSTSAGTIPACDQCINCTKQKQILNG